MKEVQFKKNEIVLRLKDDLQKFHDQMQTYLDYWHDRRGDYARGNYDAYLVVLQRYVKNFNKIIELLDEFHRTQQKRQVKGEKKS